jgi:ABC-type transport system involved in multi-copper enzyme maturation permease subunit
VTAATEQFRLGTPVHPVTFREAMDSEFAKIRTVRSTFWTVLLTLTLSIGISLLVAAITAANWSTISDESKATLDMSQVEAGVSFGVLVIGVLGVMVVSTEYSTGMMRTSLTAYPRRGTLFLAKALVLALLVLVVGLIITFASYGLATPFYSQHGIDLPLTEGADVRALLAVPVYLTLVALMAFGLGFLLRSTAGAISSLVGVLFVIPIITNFLPGTAGKDVNKIVPSNAGGAMLITKPSLTGTPTLSPLAGFITLLIWTAVIVIPAFLLFRRRDA